MSDAPATADTNASVVTPLPTNQQRRPSDFAAAMAAKRSMPAPPLNAPKQAAAAPAHPNPVQSESRQGMAQSVRGAVDSTRPDLYTQEPVAAPSTEPGVAKPDEVNAKTERPKIEDADDAAALERYRAWKDGYTLPDELADKLVPVKVRGKEHLVSVKEAAEGYQRLSDYHQSKSEIAAKERTIQETEQRHQARDANFRRFHEDISNPETIYQAFHKLGLAKQFHDGAIHYANMLKEHEQKNGSGAALTLIQQWEQQAHQSEVERIKRENAELRARLAGPPPEELEQQQTRDHLQRQLDQLQPRAFERYGLPQIEFVQRVFMSQLVAAAPPGQITPEAVDIAARAAKEIWDSERSDAQESYRSEQATRSPNPGGATRYGTTPGARRPQDAPATHANFRERMTQLNGGRNPWGL